RLQLQSVAGGDRATHAAPRHRHRNRRSVERSCAVRGERPTRRGGVRRARRSRGPETSHPARRERHCRGVAEPMVTRPRGVSMLGCLVSVLILATILYFGVRVGRVYLRYYEYRDVMLEQARFAGHLTDAQIARRLAATADSLGLPEEAGRAAIQRGSNSIVIESDYSERIELPFTVREVRLRPRATGTR